jgi:hypothetical protein
MATGNLVIAPVMTDPYAGISDNGYGQWMVVISWSWQGGDPPSNLAGYVAWCSAHADLSDPSTLGTETLAGSWDVFSGPYMSDDPVLYVWMTAVDADNAQIGAASNTLVGQVGNLVLTLDSWSRPNAVLSWDWVGGIPSDPLTEYDIWVATKADMSDGVSYGPTADLEHDDIGVTLGTKSGYYVQILANDGSGSGPLSNILLVGGAPDTGGRAPLDMSPITFRHPAPISRDSAEGRAATLTAATRRDVRAGTRTSRAEVSHIRRGSFPRSTFRGR